MRFGVRRPSIKRRIAARTSWKRMVRHNLGLKAPRGMGIFTNPKKALYNRVYNRTTVSADRLFSASSTRQRGSGGGFNLGEDVVIGLIAVALTIGFLMWLGLSFKWSIILMVGVGIVAVFGEQGGALVILGIALFIGWLLK